MTSMENGHNPKAAEGGRKTWVAPRVIESEVARKTNKATTTFTSSESHIPGTTSES